MRDATDRDKASPGTSETSFRRVLSYAWPLFIIMWLLYPVGFVVQILWTGFAPGAAVVFLLSMAAFVGVFLWLMARYPFRGGALSASELWTRNVLLVALALLAAWVEFSYASGIPYRFMYVVVAAAVTLRARHAVWVVFAATIGANLVYVFRDGLERMLLDWQGGVAPFLLIGLGVIMLGRFAATIRELEAARREIARLAVAEERLRFARDLHDLLGHSLSLITLKSELASRLLPEDPQKAAPEVRDIEEVARRSLGEVREAVSGYRRPTLSEELRNARAMLEAADISHEIEGETPDLPPATDAALAWSVREGVTNVIRHSKASLCKVRLSSDVRTANIEVSDDGEGCNSNGDSEGGSGLSGLSERVEALGGDFEASPLPEGGFRLRVSLPRDRDAEKSGTPEARIPESGR